jgi:hypothetical protein
MTAELPTLLTRRIEYHGLARGYLLDLRNLYDPEKARILGFVYRGVGRL